EKGPGCIYRFWSANPGGTLRIYIDDDEKPVLKWRWTDLFTAGVRPFEAPFVGHLAGGWFSYVPIPYRRRCKITVEGYDPRFYQITYFTFPEATDVDGFRMRLTAAETHRLEEAVRAWNAAGPEDVEKRPSLRVMKGEQRVEPGAVLTLDDIEGPGVIRQIVLELEASARFIQRQVVIRAFWDDEDSPSILCPVGDFFASGWGQQEAVGLPIGTRHGVYYCRFPMPFARRARLEIENQSAGPIERAAFSVAYEPTSRLTPDTARFHAQWRRENPTERGKDFEILRADGRGHYVGCNLSMQGLSAPGLGFLEGDEMIYVDGARDAADYNGTGTEDYFNGGWYFGTTISLPLHGCTVLDEQRGRCAAYRYHITDCVPFRSQIRVVIEHGHASQVLADYAGVAYWYQMEPHRPLPPLPAPQARLPEGAPVPRPLGAIVAAQLPFDGPGDRCRVQSYREAGLDAAGRQLLLEAARPGEAVQQTIEVANDSAYHVGVLLSHGPDYGVVSLLVDGRVVGEPLDTYAPEGVAGRLHEFGTVRLTSGRHAVALRVEGKNDKARAMNVGVDSYALREASGFCERYMVIGPFPHKGPEDMDRDFGPESDLDLSRALQGIVGLVQWEEMPTTEKGLLDLNSALRPNDDVIAYALCYVYSPTERAAQMLIGSDDQVKVWLNDELVHYFRNPRAAVPDQDSVDVRLKKGWNKVLCKVGEGKVDWGLYLRFRDPEGQLRYAPTPPQ
ncbi:MAG: glycoside hydrolase family 172 protein, partial [Armatimonadota bacterium]